MKITKNMYYQDSEESRELYWYAVNDSLLYSQMIMPCIRNLQKKYVKGTFDKEKAVVAFYHIATEASNRYFKEFGYKFDVTARWTSASDMLSYFMEDIAED